MRQPPLDEGDGEEEERNVPSELRSRPKIVRTPADGMQRDKRGDQDLPQESQQEVIKIKGEVINDDTKIKEHGEGFHTRPKLPRTPPEEQARRERAK